MRFFGLLIFFVVLPALGMEITTQVHEIDYGTKPNDEVLVLLNSGHVAKIRSIEKTISDDLLTAKQKKEWITFTLDKNRYILKMESATTPLGQDLYEELNSPEEDKEYLPTTIASMDIARKYFREGRRTTKEETQCFNRAMVWTYEWWKKHSLKSNKILIFFTRNYIRRYDFEWWFHIAPYVHVMEDGKVVEKVMDVKYTSGPRDFKQWTDIFMHRDPECPVITRYSHYADHPYTGDCFIFRTHMYTYQPADLQMYEAWGYKKDAFNMQEVKGAYLEAYDIHLNK